MNEIEDLGDGVFAETWRQDFVNEEGIVTATDILFLRVWYDNVMYHTPIFLESTDELDDTKELLKRKCLEAHSDAN